MLRPKVRFSLLLIFLLDIPFISAERFFQINQEDYLHQGYFYLLGWGERVFSNKDFSIKASVDKKEVSTGEIFHYRLEIKGKFFDPQVKLPNFKNFSVVSQVESRNYSLEGKKVILNLVWKVSLFAPNPGTFIIEPAVVFDKGKKFSSKKIQIIVHGRPLKEKQKIQPYLDNAITL